MTRQLKVGINDKAVDVATIALTVQRHLHAHESASMAMHSHQTTLDRFAHVKAVLSGDAGLASAMEDGDEDEDELGEGIATSSLGLDAMRGIQSELLPLL